MVRSFISTTTSCMLLFATCLFFSVSSFSQNPIVTENLLPGAPKSEWDVSGAGDPNIQGYATDISVNKGGTIRFKIDVTGGGTYTIRIYRLGYYQGNGARLMTNLGTFTAVNQPEPSTNTTTGLVDCGNWSESASWAVPSTAVSGVYIARLTRSTGSSHIIFIVRDDAGNAPVLFKTSDATWQAYNGYGGNSLYVGATSYPAGHAVKVSYNRPFITREGGAGGGAGEDWVFNAEYPMIRFLERNGFHVSYTTDVDMERRTTAITPAIHKVFLSVGHDEYWSAAQRTRIENARNAGVHLAFFSGNEVYWKTRWEDNNRTLVCYKEGTLGEIPCGGKCDPDQAWTGLWRDGCSFPNAGACKPENALTGQISWTLNTDAITVPGAYRAHRFWRNTSVASQAANGTVTLPTGTLGYEWDPEQYPAFYPNGRIILSNTTINGLNHRLSLYRHGSGALVFGAGTVQWSWGLDNVHDRGSAAPSTAMQQATINLLADMGVQAGSLMSGMMAASASTDVTAPVPVITSPAHNSTAPANISLTISGTATDAGGVVAGIEVSVDGGNTWQVANGTTNWTFTWTPTASGTANIRVRGFDDSGNMSVPGAAGSTTNRNIMVSGGSTTGTYSIFQPSAAPQSPRENDGSPLTAGLKFQSSQNGFITGIRFYKATGTTGTHTGTLWSRTGTRLAEIVFSNETASGWQQVMLSNPVAITQATTYVVSVHSSSGDYCYTNPSLGTAIVNGPLRALANGEDGTNGVYVYSATPTFPATTYGTSNYFVDVVFSNVTDTDPPAVNTVSPTANAGNVSRSTTVAAVFSEDMQAASISSTSFVLRDAANNLVPATVSYNAGNRTATLTPGATLNYLASYTATISSGGAGVKDLAGNALASNYVWTFTTVADLVAPEITSVLPVAGALSVNVNTTVSGIFSEAMNAGTINSSTVQLSVTSGSAVNGTVSYNVANNSVVFTPSAPLQALTNYTVLIMGGASGVKDLAGNALGSNSTWTFTTEPEPDLVPPTVVNTDPAASGTGVALNAVITAVFNEDMMASAFNSSSVELRDPSNNLLATTISYNAANRRVSITPVNVLLNTTLYTVRFKSGATGIKDVSGNAIASDYTWSFTSIADQVPPQVQNTNPVSGATGFAVNGQVTIQFNEPMDAASINNSTIELRDALSNLVAKTVTFNATTRTATLQPSVSLQNSAVYTLIVKAGPGGVKDVPGNALASQYVSYFTTVVGTISIFPGTAAPAQFSNDGSALVLGLKFRSTQAGQVVGVRFYKSPSATGVHTGNLWSSTGTKLAEIVFSNETASGWQQAFFTTPVNINANTTYVVSYHSTSGHYGITNPSMNTAFTNGPLRALASGEDGPNAVYRYSTTPQFPSSNYQTSNYFVDVLFGSTAVPDQVAPQVSSVLPANNANGIALNPEIKVTFNEAMNFASISSATIELRNAANVLVPASAQYDAGTRSATITPSATLLLNTTYRIIVKSGSSGVKDVSGNALAADYISSFTTLADQTPPTVISTIPANQADDVDPSTSVSIQFSEAMMPASLNAGTVFIQAPGNVNVAASLTYDAVNRRVVLQPASALQRNVTYTIQITGGAAGVKDLGGNALAASYSAAFTTQPDIIPPVITEVSPQANATGVPLSLQATALFSEEIDVASLVTGVVEVSGPSGNIASTYVLDAARRLLTINLQDSLPYLATCTIRIKGGSSGIKDLAGNVMAADYTWTFTSRADLQPPVVVNSMPANASTGLPVNLVPTVQFSEAMWEASLNNLSVEIRGQDNSLFTSGLLYNGTTHTLSIQPASQLPYGGTYTVTIKGGSEGVKDLAGNPLAQNYSWTFSTMNEPDYVAPTISSIVPAAAATDVLLNTVIQVQFSEPMNAAGLIASNFELRDGNGQAVPFVFTIPGNNAVSLQPSAVLRYATNYTVNINDALTDPAGNALAAFSWSFTTLADVVAPSVVSVSPAANATQVPVETGITAQFSEALNESLVTATTVQLKDAGGNLIAANISYDILTYRIHIQPLAALAYATAHTISLSGGPGAIADVNGNVMSADYTWTFTTAPFVDITAPQVLSVSPANNSTGVPIVASTTVSFSEQMDVNSINETSLEIRTGAGVLVPVTVTYNPGTLTASLVPESPLSYSSIFNVVVKNGAAGVKDLAGNPLASAYNWSFTTEADVVPPQVVQIDPAFNATNVLVSAPVNIRFSEAMLASSLTNSNIELSDASNNIITGAINYFPGTFVVLFNPSQPLRYGMVYTARVKSGTTGVKDVNGNPLVADFTWNFITEADLVAPEISTVSPANNTPDVPASVVITAAFNEEMNASTINASTVELRNAANTLIPATIAYNNTTRTISVTPNSNLSGSTVFNVLIKGGASGVKDLSGNALASSYTWSFTTVTSAISIFAPGSSTSNVENDGVPLTIGMKFRSTQAGYINGVRFYKAPGMTGAHTGNLWSSTGTKLAEVSFVNETASGWQQALFNAPVSILANTTYVVSYHSASGNYASTNPFFTSAVTNGPLRALANGEDGGNGVYRYNSTPAFPNQTYQSTNYWVDVVFTPNSGPDLVAPLINSLNPVANAASVPIAAPLTITFNEAVSPASFATGVFELRDASNALVPATVVVSQGTATLTPGSPLLYLTTYTARIRGGASGVKDLAGNALLRDSVWSFTTVQPPPPSITDNGPGGPVLVLYSASNPFSRYTIEILRAEGLNYFLAKDIAQLTATDLNNYDMVVLGEVAVNSNQVNWLTSFVNNGGTLVGFRPAPALAALFGITRQTGTLSDQYLLVNTTSGPGRGIVNQTMQFHGTADLYTLSGASSLATLYSSATTATGNPAVTLHAVGTSGGKAVAFTYDLPKSIVYTRQGNPAWAGQKRDGTTGPVRSDDLFFGGTSADWVDLNKVAIPQADEQQRLLVNILLQGNLHRKPLPRFWFLPKGLKAAIVMTGDDHSNDGTTGRFNHYLTLGPNTAQDVADWKAVRATSYMYNGTPVSNAEAVAFSNQGFEIALHLNTGCSNHTPLSFNEDLVNQLGQFTNQFPGLPPVMTHRTHCMVWSDWATTAKVQAEKGIRLDVNYYYWPGAWVQDRSGMFTGSGMPMRFADLDGSLIDCYQAPTQMTDESDISLPRFANELLDRALGTEGYYGVFVANMHTDSANHIGSTQIINSALARNIPVISSKQLLNWLDGRNNSYFGNMTWNGNQLSFPVTVLPGARNLKGMVPVNAASGTLQSITRNGTTVSYTTETIKGVDYAFFDIPTGISGFVADYGSIAARGTVENTLPVATQADNVAETASRLKAEAYPNPSASYFQLKVSGGDNQPVVVRIIDAFGTVIERHEKIMPGSIIQVGQGWKNGVYFAEVTQGSDKKLLKLVKTGG